MRFADGLKILEELTTEAKLGAVPMILVDSSDIWAEARESLYHHPEIAVSSGLLANSQPDQFHAVLNHEILRVARGEIAGSSAGIPAGVSTTEAAAILESLVAKAGIPDVSLLVLQNSEPYAGARKGRFSDESPKVAVSTALLELLDREQLRSTLGHEVEHIARGHLVAKQMQFRLRLLAATGVVSTLAVTRPLGITCVVLCSAATLVISHLTRAIILRHDEYVADSGAKRLTGDGTPLVNALLKMKAANRQQSEHVACVTRSYGHGRDPGPLAKLLDRLERPFATHPSTVARARRLGVPIQLER